MKFMDVIWVGHSDHQPTVEAFQLPAVGESPDEFIEWAENVGFEYLSDDDESICSTQVWGAAADEPVQIMPGDWIVYEAIQPEPFRFRKLSPLDFELTYQKV